MIDIAGMLILILEDSDVGRDIRKFRVCDGTVPLLCLGTYYHLKYIQFNYLFAAWLDQLSFKLSALIRLISLPGDLPVYLFHSIPTLLSTRAPWG